MQVICWRASSALRGVRAASRPLLSYTKTHILHCSSVFRAPSNMGSHEELPRSFPLMVAGGKKSEVPSIGYGTWASDGSSPTSPAKPEWITKPIQAAIDVGYRHLDTAWFYGVDKEIGAAIRSYGIDRSELFICSKVWPNFYHPDKVEVCCDKVLSEMKLDYLDAFIFHWPTAFEPTSLEYLDKATAANQADMSTKGMKLKDDGYPVIDWKHTSEPIARAAGKEGSIVPTWNAMKELVKKGKVRAIGVSNFGIADLKALLPHAQDVPISMNQVECHPWLPNTELKDFCQKEGIVMSCFSPFAGQKSDGATLLQDPTVKMLAEKNGMGVGQLLSSWAVQRGTIPLGKSGNPERIRANFSIRRLSDEDMKALADLEIPNGQGRTIDFTDTWGVKLFQN